MKIGNYHPSTKMGFQEQYMPTKSTPELAEELRVRKLEVESTPRNFSVGCQYIDIFI